MEELPIGLQRPCLCWTDGHDPGRGQVPGWLAPSRWHPGPPRRGPRGWRPVPLGWLVGLSPPTPCLGSRPPPQPLVAAAGQCRLAAASRGSPDQGGWPAAN